MNDNKQHNSKYAWIHHKRQLEILIRSEVLPIGRHINLIIYSHKISWSHELCLSTREWLTLFGGYFSHLRVRVGDAPPVRSSAWRSRTWVLWRSYLRPNKLRFQEISKRLQTGRCWRKNGDVWIARRINYCLLPQRAICKSRYPSDRSQWTGTLGPGVLWWADHSAIAKLYQGLDDCEAMTRTFCHHSSRWRRVCLPTMQSLVKFARTKSSLTPWTHTGGPWIQCRTIYGLGECLHWQRDA